MSLFLLFTTFLSFCAANVIPSRNIESNLQSRQASNLKAGSYLITYKPSSSNSPLYKGPLRVSSIDTSTFISGDLYNGTVVPNPADGSPVLPRDNYWAFLRATGFTAGQNRAFSLNVEYWAFEGITRLAAANVTDWADAATDGGYTIDLAPTTAPTGYPDPENYFEGDVKIASSGVVVGHFTLGWVSSHLRRITLEIGTAPGLEVPETDTSGTRPWKNVFDEAGYDIKVVIGKTDIPEPENPMGPGFFSNEQQHQAVLASRSPTDFDKEWKYYLLVVRRMAEQARGEMIDPNGRYNSIPREGTCIASEWIVGTYPNGTVDNTNPWPDSVRGKKFVELHNPWYRTALHEVGHFFNLVHPDEFSNDIMTDTPSFVDAGADGTTPKPFPDNITPEVMQFTDASKFLMQHRPDTHIRPGWVNFGFAAQVRKTNQPKAEMDLR
jgi:hypothetical protein